MTGGGDRDERDAPYHRQLDRWETLRREQQERTGWTSGGGWELTDEEVEEALRVSGIGTPARQDLYPVIVGAGMKHIIKTVDAWLDGAVAEPYQEQPLAQDWARVAKVGEELGEAISALIAYTGQNPRKGVHGSQEDMLGELGDVVCTALFAMQHFTQDTELTAAYVESALVKALNRATGAINP
jgi:NTP pyrophosphatase (non-canonical NTP hydrolase)